MLQTMLIIFVIYVFVSLLFFIFPTLLYRRKQLKNPLFVKALTSNKILNIAHRGGPRHATQNTIQVFTFIEKYTNCFQMDVCETADKILVVHHDHHLKRTCGIDKDIQQFKYEQLPLFMNQIVLDFGVKQIIKSNKQRIPKLEEVFKKFPHMLMNIELKTPTKTAMIQFVRLIHQFNRVNNTVVGIRSNKNFQLKNKHPEILNFFNDKKVFTLALSYLLGLSPFLKIQQNSLQIPVYSKQYEQWNVGRTQQKDKWKIKLFMKAIMLINIITRPLLWHLRRRGIITLGWVCNTQQAFQFAIKSGFQGIMTDDPILLDTYLKRKKLVIDN